MSASWFDLLPHELKQKIFRFLCESDRLKLFQFNAYKPIVCDSALWKRLDFHIYENISVDLLENFKAVTVHVEYLTWQVGHIWNFRRLCQTVGRFNNLLELDISGNNQIHDISFLRNLRKLRALCMRSCYKLSAQSTVGVVATLHSLTWLDIADCSQFREYEVEQVLVNARNLEQLNICGMQGYPLHTVRRIVKKRPSLKKLKFCAMVNVQTVHIWRSIMCEDYRGPLQMCEAMREIVLHYIVL